MHIPLEITLPNYVMASVPMVEGMEAPVKSVDEFEGGSNESNTKK